MEEKMETTIIIGYIGTINYEDPFLHSKLPDGE